MRLLETIIVPNVIALLAPALASAITPEQVEIPYSDGKLRAWLYRPASGRFRRCVDGTGRVHTGTNPTARADAIRRVQEWLTR